MFASLRVMHVTGEKIWEVRGGLATRVAWRRRA